MPAATTLLRAEDDPLLAELARDGRAAVAELAAAIHWHESTVRRRIEELRQAGLLYFDIDIDESALGVNANVMLWLRIEPACLDAAGRALAAHPEIPFAAATTGATNLAASAIFREHPAGLQLPDHPAGRAARPAVGGDRADHRHGQADRPADAPLAAN